VTFLRRFPPPLPWRSVRRPLRSSSAPPARTEVGAAGPCHVGTWRSSEALFDLVSQDSLVHPILYTSNFHHDRFGVDDRRKNRSELVFTLIILAIMHVLQWEKILLTSVMLPCYPVALGHLHHPHHAILTSHQRRLRLKNLTAVCHNLPIIY
jgi:hypothetical protein